MKYLDLTLPTPAANLACDEALLEAVEENGGPILRLWEPDTCFVVLGYANEASREVNLPACERLGIPVLRRCSGGGTVLQGPGSLNYSLILPQDFAPGLDTVTGTNRFIMERHCEVFSELLGQPVDWHGSTDLAAGGCKFSGNAQRRKRRTLLFHGTLLLDFDLDLISQALPMPSKQPDYRGNRSHLDFLTNLELAPAVVKKALRRSWSAESESGDIPHKVIQSLVDEKYGRPDWNLRH